MTKYKDDGTGTRFVIEYDRNYEFEECDGGTMPMTPERYKGHEYQKDGANVPYDEYVKYLGNPDRHVVFGVIREDKCPCCESWVRGGSIWGVDCMDNDPEAAFVEGTYPLSQLTGYLAEVAKDLEINPHRLPKN